MNGLTFDQIDDANRKLVHNAQSLIAEAKLLAQAGHYPRAFALAQIAIEELAKIQMLLAAGSCIARGMAVDWKELDTRMRSHGEKTAASMRLGLQAHMWGAGPSLTESERDQILIAFMEVVPTIIQLKNDSLYVGFTTDGVHEPSDAIDEKRAATHIKMAEAAMAIHLLISEPMTTDSEVFNRAIELASKAESLDQETLRLSVLNPAEFMSRLLNDAGQTAQSEP